MIKKWMRLKPIHLLSLNADPNQILGGWGDVEWSWEGGNPCWPEDIVHDKVNSFTDMWQTCHMEKWNKNRTSVSLGPPVPFSPYIIWHVPTEKLPADVKDVTYSDLMICTQRCGVLQQPVWTCTYVQPLLRCNYLQAVPCDPAGADFNFAALSFNSEFLHQIHLIPLHGCSPAEKQAIFRLQKMLPETWKRDAEQGGRKLERSLSQLSFSSAWWCAVIYDTRSVDPHWLRAPHPPTSHIKTLSALVSCHVTCRSPVFSYISKQTCEPVLNETSSLFFN